MTSSQPISSSVRQAPAPMPETVSQRLERLTNVMLVLREEQHVLSSSLLPVLRPLQNMKAGNDLAAVPGGSGMSPASDTIEGLIAMAAEMRSELVSLTDRLEV